MVAIGPLVYFPGKGQIQSKNLYRSMEALERVKEAFKRKCLVETNPLTDISRVDNILVVEFELED